ncbi:AlpA family transcriptional regulator [Pseudomonas sp. YY-1]|uniref:helix-turn-helix transcriptional regulator n=1 Tax=Pseudomonas sp. YY-1 TaxID=2058659 RepID=UPI000CBBDE76|nr:AlpA family transcriptional regulator [Pseudomonas sp. YY-1]PKQ40643.1 AlpA family transcriptional regulator [Pseudomonas sp. YY-1]
MSRPALPPFHPLQSIPVGNRLLRRREVELKTGKSRAAIYAAIREGTFPAPVQIGVNSVAWLEAEIDLYIAERLAARNQSTTQAT